jgi:dipeptidyl aminopeptidase/acylaminoacyl peptidase
VTANDPPVFTIHGTDDRTVPYDQAVRLDKALKAAGVPSYFITVTGGGHGGFPPQAEERAGTFFAKYLLGRDVEIATEPITAPQRQ